MSSEIESFKHKEQCLQRDIMSVYYEETSWWWHTCTVVQLSGSIVVVVFFPLPWLPLCVINKYIYITIKGWYEWRNAVGILSLLTFMWSSVTPLSMRGVTASISGGDGRAVREKDKCHDDDVGDGGGDGAKIILHNIVQYRSYFYFVPTNIVAFRST